MIPDKLSHYRILSRLGAGGMGEVYLAEDLNLGRRVALKILPEKFTRDQERVRRFEQEARAASRLSHPNILTIYEIGESDGMHYIATEFVEGLTLRRRLAAKRLDIEEAIEYGIQLSDALVAAHSHGITHRDIKPENIMLREDGVVKILDFGLAKLSESTFWGSSDPAITQAETVGEQLDDPYLTSPLGSPDDTSPGVILGTISYMSPEQARGLKVDARTDIFSLGIVLYEMVAGRTPFEGPTTGDMMVAILDRHPPPLARFAPRAPQELEWIILKALAKDREDRYQVAQSLMSDLKRLQSRLKYIQESDHDHDHDGREDDRQELLADDRSSGSSRLYENRYEDSGQIRTGSGQLARPIDTLAVLPFTSATLDPQTEYLTEAIAESLIVNLSRLKQLRVMAWSTVARYRLPDPDALQIGRNLDVRAVFTGRLFIFGSQLVIKAELVDVDDGSQIWGAQYQHPLDNLTSLEQDLSKEICEHLRLRLNEEEKERLVKKYTEDAEAYEAYLRGRYYWNQRTARGLRKAMENFTSAIELDEAYALAHAGLADCYCLLSIYSAMPPKAALPRAKSAALRALEIDEGLAEAHTSLAATLAWLDWDWESSEREFKRAIELNPAYSVAHHWYGSVFLSAFGRFEEAMEEELLARQLEPLSRVINSNLGFISYQATRYQDAVEYLKSALEIDPDFIYGRFFMGLALTQIGRYDEAIAEIQSAIELGGGRGALLKAALGFVCGRAGRAAEARKILDELQTYPTNRDVSPFYLAIIHTGLGEVEEAISHLEDACEEKFNWVVWLKTEPMFESLRREPRFQNLVRKIGLG